MQVEVKNLLNRLLKAIECEREEERLRHQEEMRKLSGLDREEKGRAIVGLRKKTAGRTIGGEYLYHFRKANGRPLGQTQISIGDQVIISQYDPLDSLNPKGLVYDISTKMITLALVQPLSMAQNRDCRLDLFINDITFARFETAITTAKAPFYSRLHTMLSGFYSVNASPAKVHFEGLNEAQNQAVSYALGNNGYFSIQGPPGTGKTYTAAHMVSQMVKQGHRVLVTADSNAAVDHLVRKLVALGESPLRIGNPIRVNADLKGYTMDYQVAKHFLFGDVKSTNSMIDALKDEQATLRRPSGPAIKGYSFVELWEMIERGRSTKNIPKEVLKDIKPWLKVQMKIDALYEKLKALRKEIQQDLLSNHRIIAATNATCGSELLELERFDWAVVDEAAQASMPSTLIPILKAERFVLVGDHFQLPPVVLSQEAKELGLDTSLMSYLAGLYPYQLLRLERQYRMHQKINDLVSSMFYEGGLVPDISVANARLKAMLKPWEEKRSAPVIVCFNVRGKEALYGDSKSFYNQAEIDFVTGLVARYLAQGLGPEQIGVITPYKAQAQLLTQSLQATNQIEVDTVDAFQGREKDMIILSFVRSNRSGQVGFLKDFRRLNVSISRAKHKLLLVGNLETLKEEPLYKELLETIELIEMAVD